MSLVHHVDMVIPWDVPCPPCWYGNALRCPLSTVLRWFIRHLSVLLHHVLVHPASQHFASSHAGSSGLSAFCFITRWFIPRLSIFASSHTGDSTLLTFITGWFIWHVNTLLNNRLVHLLSQPLLHHRRVHLACQGFASTLCFITDYFEWGFLFHHILVWFSWCKTGTTGILLPSCITDWFIWLYFITDWSIKFWLRRCFIIDWFVCLWWCCFIIHWFVCWISVKHCDLH